VLHKSHQIQKPVRDMLKLAPPLVGSIATFLRRPIHSRLSIKMLDSLTAMSFSSVTLVLCSRAIDCTAACSFSFSKRFDSRISRISACSLNASPSSYNQSLSEVCSVLFGTRYSVTLRRICCVFTLSVVIFYFFLL